MKLLHIDSSISGSRSVSRQLTASIVARLKQTTPRLELTYRDIAAMPIPQHSEALLNLKIKALSERGALHAEAMLVPVTDAPGNDAAGAQLQHDFATINAVLNEFVAADIVVLGAPMYNFGIPSQLKAWIDCLAAPAQTFRYTATGREGLCGAKRIIVGSSRGGFYSPPSDHQESYLTGFFGFLGVSDIAFVRAEGVNLGAEQRARALESALAEVATLKAA
ncbi:MAG TPA: NAD(P)H-dependent oxidoreductase [Steroidobacteraceae bacterium]